MAEGGSSTYAQRIKRYGKQREEWLQGLNHTLTPLVEQTLRKLGQAADLCVQSKPQMFTMTWAFEQLVRNFLTKWTEEEVIAEMGQKASEDAETYLQMVVKAHATVLACSTAQSCRQIISVPDIAKFYRSVVAACVHDFPHPELFCTDSIEARSRARMWIDQVVANQALAIVPVSLFAKSPSSSSGQRSVVDAQPIPEFKTPAPAPVPEPIPAVSTLPVPIPVPEPVAAPIQPVIAPISMEAVPVSVPEPPKVEELVVPVVAAAPEPPKEEEEEEEEVEEEVELSEEEGDDEEGEEVQPK